MQGSSTGQDQRNKLGNQCEINREDEDINIGAGFTQWRRIQISKTISSGSQTSLFHYHFNFCFLVSFQIMLFFPKGDL